MNPTAFDVIEKVADAVMYEGYVLYPYRASAMKNRLRWQFGVVAPREYSERSRAESWHAQTECVVEPGRRPRLAVKVRCLQLQRRSVEEPINGDSAGWRECERVVFGEREFLTWDEAVPQAVVHCGQALDELCIREYTTAFHLADARETEVIYSVGGERISRITRERWPIFCVLRVAAERAGDLVKVRVRVENATAWSDSGTLERDVALRQSLIGCHTLLHIEDGRFVSLLDPPSHAVDTVKSCVNEHTWPVLAGVSGSRDLMLSSPIILYDYPAIAPESAGDFFDATEMDEMLSLRVMTMTEQERREAAATDERARAIVERAGGPDAGNLASLHGAIRSFEELLNPASDPSPEEAFVDVGTVRLSRGCRVRLAPQKRADSMDMFLAGRVATIAAVHRDLENRAYIAVTLDDDPGADLRHAVGRFFYFSPDEVRPVEAEANAGGGR
jgi:hypothetical protein